MVWVRLEPAMFEDEKIEGIDAWSFMLWIASICYCNQRLGDNQRATDGLVSQKGLERIAVDAGIRDVDKAVKDLEQRKLWKRVSTGWQIVNYAKYQKTREQLEREREQSRARQKRWYDRHVDRDPPPSGRARNGVPDAAHNASPNDVRSGPELAREQRMLDIEELRSRRSG